MANIEQTSRSLTEPHSSPKKSLRESPLDYARRFYLDPSGSEEDLVEDLTRIKFLKRLVTRYRDRQDLKERLVLNHLIILFNVFEPNFVRHLLRGAFSEKDWPVINTFLVYLHRSLDVTTIDTVLLHYLRTRV